MRVISFIHSALFHLSTARYFIYPQRVISFIHSALFHLSTARYFSIINSYPLILKDFLIFYQYKTRTTGLFKMAKRAKMRSFQK
jgi:hypothetical protein